MFSFAQAKEVLSRKESTTGDENAQSKKYHGLVANTEGSKGTKGQIDASQTSSHSSFSTPEHSALHGSTLPPDAPRTRQPPDTSEDLSRNWLTATAAPKFTRAGLAEKGVVMPVKAPETWVQRRQVQAPISPGRDGAMNEVDGEDSNVKTVLDRLGRLGRAFRKKFF